MLSTEIPVKRRSAKVALLPGKSDWQQEYNNELQDIFLFSGDMDQKKILYRILDTY